MAQADRRVTTSGEFIGKDVFLKSFQQQSGNISAAQLKTLVSSVQNLNLSVLKVGDFTAATQTTVNFILEGADNLANGDLAGHVIADVSF
ncbi:hypothetical protein N9C44_00105 [bacterium]|mgnify:CR=1 FL=1|jgi:hypothetical protein|nr:hypothetical protein [bacterium]|tara:strand:+ start:264 stop:533 length:270 start_codon:yes stop_codon:yes gene_type:complete